MIARDFGQKDRDDFTVRKQVIWSYKIATKSELIIKEHEFIKSDESNNPEIGYNKSPKFKKGK